MTNTPPKQGVRARERNALQRIEGLEQDVQNLVAGVQNALNQLEGRIRQLGEIVDSTVNILGKEVVEKAIETARAESAQAQAAAAKAALDKALEAGELEPVLAVEDNSIITGVEYDKEGKVTGTGYVQLAFASVKPEFQEKLKGQCSGFKLETDAGSFEITGVYNQVEKPVPTEEVAPEAPVSAPEVTPQP